MAALNMSRETRFCLAAFAMLSTAVIFNLVFFQGRRVPGGFETAALGPSDAPGNGMGAPYGADARNSTESRNTSQGAMASPKPAAMPQSGSFAAPERPLPVATAPPAATISRIDLVRSIQRALAARGLSRASHDGLMGLMTRAAIMAYESDSGLALTGAPSEDLLRRLQGVTPSPVPARRGPPAVALERPGAIGTVLDYLVRADVLDILSLWSAENSTAMQIYELAVCLTTADTILSKYQPLPEAKTARTRFTGFSLERLYIFALLATRNPYARTNQRLYQYFERFRLWALIHALERATQNLLYDRYLRYVADRLRLAGDGVNEWLRLAEQLLSGAQGYSAFELHIDNKAQYHLSNLWLDKGARPFLQSLSHVARREFPPDAVSVNRTVVPPTSGRTSVEPKLYPHSA